MNCDCTAGTMCLDKNISPRSQSFPRLFSRQTDFFFFVFIFFFFALPSLSLHLPWFVSFAFCVWIDLMKNCLMYNMGWCRVWCLVTFPSALGAQFAAFRFLGQSQLLQWHLGACDGLESTLRNWCTTESAEFTFDIFINLILEASLAENRKSNSICVVLDCN